MIVKLPTMFDADIFVCDQTQFVEKWNLISILFHVTLCLCFFSKCVSSVVLLSANSSSSPKSSFSYRNATEELTYQIHSQITENIFPGCVSQAALRLGQFGKKVHFLKSAATMTPLTHFFEKDNAASSLVWQLDVHMTSANIVHVTAWRKKSIRRKYELKLSILLHRLTCSFEHIVDRCFMKSWNALWVILMKLWVRHLTAKLDAMICAFLFSWSRCIYSFKYYGLY